MALTGKFKTSHASKYLQQLCKHFGHKTDVEFTETEGSVQFGFGAAHLSAEDEMLTVVFDLKDADATDSAKGVIDSHLERFAFREDFKHMEWTD